MIGGAACTYPQQLLTNVDNTRQSLSALYLATKQDKQRAYGLFLDTVIAQQDKYWIIKAASLSTIDEIFELAMAADATHLKIELLTDNARNGHGASQFQLALMSKRPDTRIRWLIESAEQGNKQALTALRELQKLEGDTLLKTTWLPQLAKLEVSFLIEYAKGVWREKSPSHAIDMLRQSHFHQTKTVQILLQNIEAHRLGNGPAHHLAAEQDCNIAVQFISDSLNSLDKAKQLSLQYRQDKRFEDHSVCFNAPIWIAPQRLNCSNESGQRLSCDMAAIFDVADKISFTHAVVIAQNGVANVHNGIMYLDKHDDYLVFLHELAHFAGFVDEYPLSSELAENFCHRDKAPNLVFANNQSEIIDNPFPSLALPVTLTKARTCQLTSRIAFKPVTQMTFMEYHDAGEIPDVYLHIWKQVLDETKLLTPVFVNLAQWFESQNDQQQAQYWWNKYYQYQQTSS